MNSTRHACPESPILGNVPGPPPSIPTSQQARCMDGISPVSPRCCSHVDAINMGATPGRYRSNTAAIPWRHHSDTGPGVVSSLGGHPRGRPILIRMELHPAGLLPLPEPSVRALAPAHESPRSRQPRMSTSFAPKGLHELALQRDIGPGSFVAIAAGTILSSLPAGRS